MPLITITQNFGSNGLAIARNVAVEVSDNGITSITGVSSNIEDRKRIEAVVGRIPGVSKVVSRVEVIRGAI